MAAGSQKTYGGWESHVCEVCGERVTLKGCGIWMRRLGSKPVSLHNSCARAWFAEQKVAA